MLVLLAVVLCGSALVIGRLSSGASVDLGRLNMSVLDIREDPARNDAGGAEAAQPETEQFSGSSRAKAPAAVQATPAPQDSADSFTLTVGGSISLSGEVRKNSRSTDAKVADYADVMMLLAPRISSDVNIVFMENILSGTHKTSDVTAPAEAAVLLTEAGFDTAACGFSQAYANGRDGIDATRKILESRGIRPLGIRAGDDAGSPEIRSINGIQAAFLQYTANVPSKTRKSMVRDGTDGMLPEAELSRISRDIASAREQGAEVVAVLVSWGKTGQNPDKSQRELAAGIAQAGADLIVGNGSHVPQAAEYLAGRDGNSVLCVWSLGTLLSGDRSNIKRLSGYLLHVTIRRNGQGGADVLNPEYTPVYTWKYRQDGRYYYRCIVSAGEAPDGMDNEQRKSMAKAADTVAGALKDSPLSPRGQADAD